MTARSPARLNGLDAPDTAVLLLRVFFGGTLVYGVADNVFDDGHMREFRDFLAANGFPWPLASAYLSAYSQFLCGLLILVGWLTRPAAAIMAINFLVALAMVHVGLPFSQNIAPLAMLVCSIFFVLHGPGRYAVAKAATESPRHRGET